MTIDLLDLTLVALALITSVLLTYYLLLVVVAVVLAVCMAFMRPETWKAFERSKAYRIFETLARWSFVNERYEPVGFVFGIAWMILVALVIIRAALER